jgi:mono/diheme cytochrome c family protein
MRKNLSVVMVVTGVAILGLLGATSWTSPGVIKLQAATPGPSPTPNLAITPLPTLSGMPGHHVGEWIIINLPADAPQVSVGAEIYRLVCRDCHGDRGQGLTSDWRAQWAPADQNCWQSKCHGPNHPQDGFELPYSPPITGAAFTSRFGTAQELFVYIRQSMPWYAPGSLIDKQAWAVSALVLQMNGIDPGVELDLATASKIVINPELASRPPTQTPTQAAPVKTETSIPAAPAPFPLWAIGGLALIIVVIIAALSRMRHKAGSKQD